MIAPASRFSLPLEEFSITRGAGSEGLLLQSDFSSRLRSMLNWLRQSFCIKPLTGLMVFLWLFALGHVSQHDVGEHLGNNSGGDTGICQVCKLDNSAADIERYTLKPAFTVRTSAIFLAPGQVVLGKITNRPFLARAPPVTRPLV